VKPRSINSIYIHIPFCEKFCSYCHFVKIPLDRFDLDRYVSALVREIGSGLKDSSLPVATLYLGGGTPSLLKEHHLLDIIGSVTRCRPLSSRVEFTLEANPNHVTEKFLSLWRRVGINRLSIGVQSFDDAELKYLGRDHDGFEALQAVRLAAASGFRRISVDLLCGLKGQTWQRLKKSIVRAVELPIDHLSLYILDKPGMTDPREEHLADLYDKARKFLNQTGFRQYEISSFARPGGQSRHNRVYWRNEPYHGFGAAASGFDGTCETRNEASIQAYCQGVMETGAAEALREYPDLAVRRLVTGLRLRTGLPESALAFVWSKTQDLIENGVLKQALGRIVIPDERILQTNSVLTELI
jgi:oxygen-independent coproporphyrinogen-3 oxidase